jgi:hypothetical protein
MRQVIQALRDWSNQTGLKTASFILSFFAAYIVVAIGLAILQSSLGYAATSPFKLADLPNDPYFGLACLLYGLLWCVACHACYKRTGWGPILVWWLVIPGVIGSCWSGHLPWIVLVPVSIKANIFWKESDRFNDSISDNTLGAGTV